MRILIACGGTGGHLTPGIAVAQQLEKLGHSVLLVVSEKSIDKHLTAAYGDLSFCTIPGSGFGPRPGVFLKFFWNGLCAFVRARKLFRREKFDAALAFGGFSAVGVGLAAASLRKPLYLHESNLLLGKAIRLLVPLARKVFIPPPLKNSQRFRRHEKFIPMAYPLRKDFVPMERAVAREELGLPTFGKLLLLTGGSQGARVLLRWMEENESALALRGFHGLCLGGLGARERETSLAGFDNKKYIMRYLQFHERMHLLYSAADVALCRAGAGTVAELIAAALPSVLVPYPYAAGNHQLANARAMESAGAAVVVEQDRLDGSLEAVTALAERERSEKMIRCLVNLRCGGENVAHCLAACLLKDLQSAVCVEK